MEGEIITLQDAFTFDYSAGYDEDGRLLGTHRADRCAPSVRRAHRRSRHRAARRRCSSPTSAACSGRSDESGHSRRRASRSACSLDWCSSSSSSRRPAPRVASRSAAGARSRARVGARQGDAAHDRGGRLARSRSDRVGCSDRRNSRWPGSSPSRRRFRRHRRLGGERARPRRRATRLRERNFAALGGLLFALLTPVGAKVIVNVRTSRRRAKFADQVDDTVQLIAGGLRAGHGLIRSVAAVASDAESPTSEELARVVNETRLGRNLADSLGGHGAAHAERRLRVGGAGDRDQPGDRRQPRRGARPGRARRSASATRSAVRCAR